jgi:opacity protein-like surface antigen
MNGNKRTRYAVCGQPHKEEEPMKKIALLSVLVLALTVAAAAQNLPRFELNVYGGYGLKDVNLAGDYFFNWSSYWLTSIEESSTFTATSKGGMFFGGGLAYYFHPNIGVALNFGYFKTSIDSVTSSDLYWKWNDGRNYHAYPAVLDNPLEFIGTDNYFQSMPISFNIVGRFGQGSLQGYVQAGPTLFLNKAFLESEIVYGLTYVIPNVGYQTIDGIIVPMDLNQSWSSFGADFGGGLTFWFSPSIGITLDARYFFSPKKDFGWNFFLGEYEGFFGNINYDFDQTDVDGINEEGSLSMITINPSFFQFGIGIKIRLY